jgi:hypothetical protein
VIRGRFVTRQVDEIARVEILPPDGTTETLEGTPIHPIWSVDRQDWIPLGELCEGEHLQAADGVAVVLSLTLLRRSVPVYNIEVHGEHVYQVGELGLLVHNACTLRDAMIEMFGHPGEGWYAAHIFPENGFWWADGMIKVHRKKLDEWGLLNSVDNGFWTDSRRHLGTHTKACVEALLERFKRVKTPDQAIAALDDMWGRKNNYEWGAH